MKKIIALLCMMAFVMTGCGEISGGNSEKTAAPEDGRQYTAGSIALLPDERMFSDDLLLTADLQTNQQGEPALYQVALDPEMEDDEYAAIVEYTLNGNGDWQTKEFCKKALMKRLQKETEYVLEFLYIQRGDDGNLYILMKQYPADRMEGPIGQERDRTADIRYSVLAVDEGNDTFQEVRLQTQVTSETGEETDYAKEYDVTGFHVMEDGTVFLVFEGSSAMWFEGATGLQINMCPTIADSAFGKNVAYEDSRMLYFSGSSKLFGILDSDTLEVVSYFGEEISEEDRKYEWYFDTDTTMWQTYAFNQSGLYRINDSGKKASAQLISATGSFKDLADAEIYDILVGADEELYILLRRPSEGGDGYTDSWEFGVVQYQPKS